MSVSQAVSAASTPPACRRVQRVVHCFVFVSFGGLFELYHIYLYLILGRTGNPGHIQNEFNAEQQSEGGGDGATAVLQVE